MIGVNRRVMFDALWTHEFEARSFCTKIGDGLSFVLVAGNVVSEIGFHVLECKGLLHLLVM